jgi:hypothetical protein
MQEKSRKHEINHSEARLETQDWKRHTFGKNGNPTTITHNETERNSVLGLGWSLAVRPNLVSLGLESRSRKRTWCNLGLESRVFHSYESTRVLLQPKDLLLMIPWYLGHFDTNYIILRNVEIFTQKIFCEGKYSIFRNISFYWNENFKAN